MADSLANDPGASPIVVPGLPARCPAEADVSEPSQTGSFRALVITSGARRFFDLNLQLRS